MGEARYVLVDVFAEGPFKGNPLAVFPDGAQVPERLHQTVARELNLSETTFVYPPRDDSHDFGVRIYTPAEELPFAGHPTLGTSFVLALEGRIAVAGGKGATRLREKVGVIPVELDAMTGGSGSATMQQPKPEFDAANNNRAGLAKLVSLEAADLHPDLPPQVVSCGVPYLILPLRDLASAHRARPRADLWESTLAPLGTPNVLVVTRETGKPAHQWHARMFAPHLGVVEDPATGSAAGPLGAYTVRHRVLPADPAGETAMTIEQGIEMGRPSVLRVRVRAVGNDITAVLVSGECHRIGEGKLHL
jgi:trans-2,3-dihydro-3-hydroxyanthranilate isomerase